MRAIRFVLMAGTFAIAASATAGNHGNTVWTRLNGSALRIAIRNAELGDGTHYAYRFHANGNFDGTEMARSVRGTWRVTAQGLCWTWIRPPGSEECYTVERMGRQVRGFRNGAEAWSGTLTPIQASK